MSNILCGQVSVRKYIEDLIEEYVNRDDNRFSDTFDVSVKFYYVSVYLVLKFKDKKVRRDAKEVLDLSRKEIEAFRKEFGAYLNDNNVFNIIDIGKPKLSKPDRVCSVEVDLSYDIERATFDNICMLQAIKKRS